ncbi:MAG: hypothetical protein ACPGLV_03910 [Bacteroidia bacterium]
MSKLTMIKLFQMLIMLSFISSCYYGDDSPCYGYRGNYNQLQEPDFFKDLNEWVYVITDTSKTTDTLYIDSFVIDAFITQYVGDCYEDCETYIFSAFGKKAEFKCVLMAAPSNVGNTYDEYEYDFRLNFKLDSNEIIQYRYEFANTNEVKFKNDSGLVLVNIKPYTIRRIR